MKILDDVMPLCLQNDLEDYMLSPYAPWSFIQDSTYANRIDKTDTSVPSFALTALAEANVINEAVFSITRPIIVCASDTFGIDPASLLRVRYGMHIPTPSSEHNNPHVDCNIPHTVVLYYVNDSDGDTFFFNTDGSLMNRISPKKGRAIMFDGSIKHASSVPSKNPRVVLNLNFRGIQS